jgi:nucleoid-associated protein YgaU
MGLFDFLKNAGRKLGVGDEQEKGAGAGAPSKAPQMTPEEWRATVDRRRAAAFAKLVADMGLQVQDLGVKVEADLVTLTGTVRDQELREKVVLLVGNTEGVGRVDDRLKVAAATPAAAQKAAEFYTVKKGDTLSEIAQRFYGDPNQYHRIFAANKPMLEDPDKIYAGQVLRIPEPAMAASRA